MDEKLGSVGNVTLKRVQTSISRRKDWEPYVGKLTDRIADTLLSSMKDAGLNHVDVPTQTASRLGGSDTLLAVKGVDGTNTLRMGLALKRFGEERLRILTPDFPDSASISNARRQS